MTKTKMRVLIRVDFPLLSGQRIQSAGFSNTHDGRPCAVFVLDDARVIKIVDGWAYEDGEIEVDVNPETSSVGGES